MGIKADVVFRKAVIAGAYLSIGSITGTAKGGWNADVRMWANKAARDTGVSQIHNFPISIPGSGAGSDPMRGTAGSAPEEAGADVSVAPQGSAEPYPVLYAALMARYPNTGVRCD